MADGFARFGVVAIGRNEGERLRRCLQSIPQGVPVAYVDSASTDGSAEFAREQGAFVVALDLSLPFTAARARNEGFERLLEERPGLEFVQFVDGDCEIEPGWLETALEFLVRHPQTGAVFGRRRERFPEASLYNALCDREWDTPVGEAMSCGGDSMVRTAAFLSAGKFDPRMVAHEEPEMSCRMLREGFTLMRIDAPMTAHDAAIHRFGQWWKRSQRAGYGYAQAFLKHLGNPLNPAQGLFRRAVLWGMVMPLLCLAATLLFGWPGLVSFLVFPLQILRIWWRDRHAGRIALAASALNLLSKFAEGSGIARYGLDRLTGRARSAILYK